jgi:DNA-binding NarL/FixJ family response regulator
MRDCGRIFVVDDDAGIRELLAEVLEHAGFSVRKLASADEALRAAEEEMPALVLLDVELGGTSGYTVCAELRRLYGDNVGIIFVSGARTEPSDRMAGLLLGADDYIVKPFDPDELVARVRRLSARASRGASRQDVTSNSTSVSVLTPREQEVLSLLVDGLNQNEIANRLFISPSTVASHIQRILDKLGVHSRAEAVAFAAREGLARPSATGH